MNSIPPSPSLSPSRSPGRLAQTGEIVFIHSGNNSYLHYALYQAQASSPGLPITLLGDVAVSSPIQVRSVEEFHSSSELKFKKIYKHRSYNTLVFEQFCWLRWFLLLEYMTRQSLDFVWYFDSDVLLYSDLLHIHPAGVPEHSCGFLVPDQQSLDWASGHASYWTKAGLEKFCDFILKSFTEQKYIDQYERKWQHHLDSSSPGGVCDMTTLYLFREFAPGAIRNLAAIDDDSVFDMAISESGGTEPDQYVMFDERKLIIFKNQTPYVKSAKDQSLLRAHCLHFQGESKRLMPFFYKGRHFPGKLRNDFAAVKQMVGSSIAKWRR